MSAWEDMPLGALLEPGRGISYGIVQPGEDQPGGVPIVRVNAVKGGRIDTGSPLRVAADVEAQYERTRLRGGELVVTLVGTVGEAAEVPCQLAGWNVARAIGVIPVRGDVGARWVRYVLGTERVQHLIDSWCNTTVQKTLNLKDVARIPITLPPAGPRKAISHVLGALDDKIELNRRMNETLEAMARAIFNSWFVDFDPVRAKAEGRAPAGMDAATAALFPGRFEGSELGEIPRDWRRMPLIETTSYLRRGLGPSYVGAGGICVINQKCVRNGTVEFAKARRHDATKKAVDGRELRVGDVLVNSTGVGTLGRVGHVRRLDELTVVDSHVTVVRAKADVLAPAVLAASLVARETEIEGLGEGSTGQTELSRERLGRLPLLVPPVAVQYAFSAAVVPLHDLLASNETQSCTLAALRDALLPKLLSGELRVRDADRIVERAV